MKKKTMKAKRASTFLILGTVCIVLLAKAARLVKQRGTDSSNNSTAAPLQALPLIRKMRLS